MRTLQILLVLLCCCIATHARAQESPAVAAGSIWVLDLDGAVGPATSDYLLRGMEKAALADAALIVIRMNTPGGLDGS